MALVFFKARGIDIFNRKLNNNYDKTLKYYLEKAIATAISFENNEKSYNIEQTLRKMTEIDVKERLSFIELKHMTNFSNDKETMIALYKLGLEYYRAENIPRDDLQAGRLFRQAAEKGFDILCIIP